MEYNLGHEAAVMRVKVDRESHVIHYHMAEGEHFEEVEGLLDYDTVRQGGRR